MDVKLCAAVAAAALLVPGAAVASAADRNHDHIPDRWEQHFHLSLHANQAHRDQDHDGLDNANEFRDHTSPRSVDSNHDGVKDGAEDADHDGVTNVAEEHVLQEAPPAVDPAPPAPAGADTPLGSVASYAQSPGFGGPLAIAAADGTVTHAYFGEKADLECGPAAVGPFAPCGKENLQPGTPVAAAAHGINAYGYDVWTTIDLVTLPAPAPVPDPVPAPAPVPAPVATGSVFSYDGGSDVLVVARPGNNEQPAGRVTPTTTISCLVVADGLLTGQHACGPDALVAGTPLAIAQRGLVDGVLTWTNLVLLTDGS